MGDATAMSGINDDIVDELLDALDMAMPDVPEGDVGTTAAAAATFADVMQATFQWNPAEADSNVQQFFPYWQMHGAVTQGHADTAGMPCHPSPFAKQQQALLFNPSHLPVAGAAANIHGSHAATRSPFAGFDAGILQQPAAPAAAPPAAQYACSAVQQAAAHSTTPQQQQQQQLQHQKQQQQQELHNQQQPTSKRGRPQKVAGLYSKGYSTILKYRQRKKDMVRATAAMLLMFRVHVLA
jgi:hypothetical protein